ncbi:phage protease [Hoeflea sp.]|uniref:phage protease n=1 Tax=Hoeflea sp. TaxID=1940281 RepID=UPI003A90B174
MNKSISALIVSMNAAAGAPEWLHLLPAEKTFGGVDGRGPYVVEDREALASRFNAAGSKIPVDENHSIDLAGKSGHPSPARGWIVEMQARADGVWGRVEWTAEGKALVEGKAYGYLSPVLLHTVAKPHRVDKILRVALTNEPNLASLKSLHSQEEQTMLEELRKALGLPETTDEAAVIAAVTSAHAAVTAHTALMSRITEAAGVDSGTAGDALVTAIQTKVAVAADDADRTQLVNQVTSLQSQLTTLATTTAKDKAVNVIEAAIEAGKLVPALRDHMIARHMKNPADVEAELALMPSLHAGGLGKRPAPKSGETARTEEDDKILAMMGVDAAAYDATAKSLFGKEA